MEERGGAWKSQGRIDFMHETHFTASRAIRILSAHSKGA
jgi:hypothetical protein